MSADIRRRVIAARERQSARFPSETGLTNSSLPMERLRPFCILDNAGQKLLESAMDRLRLSARSHDRILRTARTIADLAESEHVLSEHLAEALVFRSGV